MGDGQDLDGAGSPRFADLLDPAGTYGWPVAATVEDAAELLAVPLPRVAAAAKRVEPYRHQDGTPRWSVRLLERELSGGRRRGGSPWRAQNRATYRRDHGPDGSPAPPGPSTTPGPHGWSVPGRGHRPPGG